MLEEEDDVDPRLVPGRFIRVRPLGSSEGPQAAERVRALLRCLGVRSVSRAEFFRDHLLTRLERLEPVLRNGAMLTLLREAPQLCRREPSLREALSATPCVPCAGEGGGLKRPGDLYSPLNPTLPLLLARP